MSNETDATTSIEFSSDVRATVESIYEQVRALLERDVKGLPPAERMLPITGRAVCAACDGSGIARWRARESEVVQALRAQIVHIASVWRQMEDAGTTSGMMEAAIAGVSFDCECGDQHDHHQTGSCSKCGCTRFRAAILKGKPRRVVPSADALIAATHIILGSTVGEGLEESARRVMRDWNDALGRLQGSHMLAAETHRILGLADGEFLDAGAKRVMQGREDRDRRIASMDRDCEGVRASLSHVQSEMVATWKVLNEEGSPRPVCELHEAVWSLVKERNALREERDTLQRVVHRECTARDVVGLDNARLIRERDTAVRDLDNERACRFRESASSSERITAIRALCVEHGREAEMKRDIDEGERQLLLLALAKLSLERPGFDDALNRLALKFDRAEGMAVNPPEFIVHPGAQPEPPF